jgi:hypothetical protein
MFRRYAILLLIFGSGPSIVSAQTLQLSRAAAVTAGNYSENASFKLVDQFGMENLGQMHNSLFNIGAATEVFSLPDVTVPDALSLKQNFPNPFNQSTFFCYSVPKSGKLYIDIYSVLGQYITTLYSGEQLPGTYQVVFNGLDRQNVPLPSGVYFCRLTTGLDSRIVKFSILR